MADGSEQKVKLPAWFNLVNIGLLVTNLGAIIAIIINIFQIKKTVEDLKFNEVNNVKSIFRDMVTNDAPQLNKELFIAMLYDSYKGGEGLSKNRLENIDRFDLVLDISEVFMINIMRKGLDEKISEKNQRELFFFNEIVRRIDTTYHNEMVSKLKGIFELQIGAAGDRDKFITNSGAVSDTGATFETNAADSVRENQKQNTQIITQNFKSWICFVQVDKKFEYQITSNQTRRDKFNLFVDTLSNSNVIVPPYELIKGELKRNDIRYFYLDDEHLAKMAQALLKDAGIEAEIIFLPKYRGKIPRKQIEIWLSSFNN